MEFTKVVQEQLHQKGITQENVLRQLENFRKGFPPVKLAAPATPGNGIIPYDKTEADRLARLYDAQKHHYDIIKFVPASGAATRMFKELYTFLEDGSETENIKLFFQNIRKFPFFTYLNQLAKENNINLLETLDKEQKREVIKLLLTPAGLNYGSLPKALLPFHTYQGHKGLEIKTALEEHLLEGILYAANHNQVKFHFTVSEEHIDLFDKSVNEIKPPLEQKYNVRLIISHSIQNPSTDQIVVDSNKRPLYDSQGRLVFNPGGHGALLYNLDRLEEDIIFIKNIDNVQKKKYQTVRQKKFLAGKLIEIQQRVHHYLSRLETRDSVKEIADFCTEVLQIKLPAGFEEKDLRSRKRFLHALLDRPIRVAGMVLNEGEPGGGPFWVENNDGSTSLQIVEKAEINLHDAKQTEILNASTHFNPVDIVCYTKDYRNNKFPLTVFRDDTRGFISRKNKYGKEVFIQELPGLWNGAMADWLTVFVEVPPETFTPVKTVFDLLRPGHMED